MSLQKVGGIVGLGRMVPELQENPFATNRQGVQIVQDWVTQLAIEGFLFHAQQGDAATLLNFNNTTYDEDQPEFALRVPTGRLVIPISLKVTLQDAAGTDNHVIWSRTTNDIGNGTSTEATISAMRSDAPRSSGCFARSLYTANATAATGLIEIARFFDAFAQAAGSLAQFEWNIRTASAIPILVGPATLQLNLAATTTAAQGFGEYVWAEFETHDLVAKIT